MLKTSRETEQQLMRELDAKYDTYIQQLLIQKRLILFKIQYNLKQYETNAELRCKSMKSSSHPNYFKIGIELSKSSCRANPSL